MLNFNLIPPEEKIAIDRLRRVNIISGILKYLILILIAFCIAIFITNISFLELVNSQKDSLEKLKNDSIMKQVLSLDEKINSLNSNIEGVFKIQEGIQYFSPTLEKIIDLVPGGIYITDLQIEKKVINESVPSPTSDQEKNQSIPKETTTEPSNAQIQPQAPFWQITLTGHANTRDQLISFNENLKNSSDFSHVDIPIQNVIKPTDIDFTITFRIKK